MPFRTGKTKIYQYDLQIGGRRFRGSTGTDDYEAAKAVEAEIRRNAKAKPTTDYTISEAFGTYHLEVCQHQPSAATSKSQAKAILAHIPAKTKIANIAQADLMRMTQKMRATCANGTVNRRLQYMGRAIRHMVSIHRATMPDLDFRTVEAKEPQERVRELSRDEQARLFKNLPPDLKEPVLFCLMTGARISTMANLQWREIGETDMLFRLKGGMSMRYPITREMRAMLSALPRSNVIDDRRYVFTRLNKQTSERTRIVPQGGVFGVQFRNATVDAGIIDFRFHDLRHTFATRMLRQTGNIKLVSRLLGHSSIETTARYAHVLVDDMRAALEGFSVVSDADPQNKPQSVRSSD